MIERSPKAREIMANTRQLLTVGGYKSFSYADLAERVGIRKASIHHHFPSKEDLVHAVVQEYRAEARAGMEAMDQQIHDPLIKVKGTPISGQPVSRMVLRHFASVSCLPLSFRHYLPILPLRSLAISAISLTGWHRYLGRVKPRAFSNLMKRRK